MWLFLIFLLCCPSLALGQAQFFPQAGIRSWNDLEDIPAGFADGVDNTGAGGSALATQIDGVEQCADTVTYDFDTSDFTATESPSCDFDITIKSGGIDHDATQNFVANEHIDHTSVTLTAGAGLSGGGDISANRSLATASTEADFLNDGDAVSLTCGASQQGKIQVMSDGDLEWCDGAATPALQSVDASIATHASDASAHHAQTTDTDTLTTGTLDHERGGLEADVSAYAGLIRINAGSTTNVTDLSGLNTALGSSIADGAHTTDTNANTLCAGTTTYLDGEGNCDDISTAYEAADADLTDLADGSLTGTKVGFADTDSNFAATNIQAAVEELDDANVSGPNAADGKVNWEQLVNVPAGFADGTDDASSTGDAIEIEDGDNAGTFTGADTTARFDDSGDINFAHADGGAGGPDIVTATVRADSVALTTDTTGNYIASCTDGAGITGCDGGSEGAALTLAATLGVAIDASEITDDSILEADLDLVDTPADEECLTYEAGAGGDFEWQPCGGAGANSFETHSTPNGTSPVAASSTDTLTWTDGNAITITGDSGTDAITVAVEIKDNAEDAVGSTQSVSGLEFESAELTLLQGCADNQILKWDETEDDWNCEADATGGGIDPGFDNASDPIVMQTTTKDVVVGTSAVNTSKLTIDGDADQVQLSIQGNATQTDSVVIVENSAGTEVANIDVDGTILTAVGLDGIGAVDMDYGSADITDHTFITDGTGDAEIVLPAGSISGTEILDDTVALGTDTTGNYLASCTNGSGITGCVASEGGTPTLAATLGTDIAAAEIADGDHGDFTYATGVATLDIDVVSTAEMADADHGDFTYSAGVATLDIDVVSTAEMADADHGDFTYSAGVATLDIDVVSTAEMADADHGDFTYSGGTATLDAGVVAANELAVQFETRMLSFNLEDPAAGDDGNFQAKIPSAATLVRLSCSTTAGSISVNLYERAENAPNTGTTDMATSDLACNSDTTADATTSFTDSAVAADAVLALGLASDATTGVLRVFVEYTID